MKEKHIENYHNDYKFKVKFQRRVVGRFKSALWRHIGERVRIKS